MEDKKTKIELFIDNCKRIVSDGKDISYDALVLVWFSGSGLSFMRKCMLKEVGQNRYFEVTLYDPARTPSVIEYRQMDI